MQLAQSIKENITILHCAEMLGYHPVQRKGNTLSWTLQEHDSLVINLDPNGCQRFIWNSQRIHGSVIDFYMAMTGSTQDRAIQDLGNILKEKSISSWALFQKKEQSSYHPIAQHPMFQLPQPDESNNRRMYAYLCKTRKIEQKLVVTLAKEGLIYQDVRGNVVFTGKNPDTNKTEYACLRGTLSSRQYRGEAHGSKKDIGFYFNLYTETPPTKLFVCESPIDAMSVASMLLNYNRPIAPYAFLSLGGTSLNALEFHIQKNPQIDTVYLCQDRDDAGNHSRLSAHTKLREWGFQGKIVDKPPIHKDFNEDLLQLKHLTQISKAPALQPNTEMQVIQIHH